MKGGNRLTHGHARPGRRTPEYRAWTNMLQRCRNPRDPRYAAYGGRGIAVCAEWESFEAFIAAMGPRPSATHSLDRVDNDGNYEPGNCRWATRAEQYASRRSAHWRRSVLV